MNDKLRGSKTISLVRVPNGWIAHGENLATHINPDRPLFVFESTQALAKQLVDLIGESGWKVTAPTPPRDPATGHFLKAAKPVTQ
jgi:hypothetical protein